MFARRIAGGLAAASFALMLLVAAAPAAAGGVIGGVPWWAAGPVPGASFTGGRQFQVPPPVLADPRYDWRAAQGYRWRPIEAPRPPPRVAWSPPAPPTATPARPVVLRSWGPVPPRLVAWRAPVPTIVTVDGMPYRFRPAAPWPGPSVAQAGRWPGTVGYPAYAPVRPPQPSQVAPWPASGTMANPPLLSQQRVQPPPSAPAHTWYGYRFRPDPRFVTRGPPPGAPGPWYGQTTAADSGAWAPGGDSRAVSVQVAEPRALWGRTVAYRYD